MDSINLWWCVPEVLFMYPVSFISCSVTQSPFSEPVSVCCRHPSQLVLARVGYLVSEACCIFRFLIRFLPDLFEFDKLRLELTGVTVFLSNIKTPRIALWLHWDQPQFRPSEETCFIQLSIKWIWRQQQNLVVTWQTACHAWALILIVSLSLDVKQFLMIIT